MSGYAPLGAQPVARRRFHSGSYFHVCLQPILPSRPHKRPLLHPSRHKFSHRHLRHQGCPRLYNRPAGENNQGQADTASGGGLKRGRSNQGAQGMDIETSSEPELKQRRVEEPATTPERLKALIDAGDITSLGALLRQAPELLDAECIQPSSNHAATPPPLLCSVKRVRASCTLSCRKQCCVEYRLVARPHAHCTCLQQWPSECRQIPPRA